MVRNRDPVQMVDIDGKGQGMQATRDVKPGERLLAEEPLVSFTPIPKDVTCQKEWLLPGSGPNGEALVNGKDTIAADIRKLPKPTKAKFRRLHGTSPRQDGTAYTENDPDYEDHDLRRVALNSFSEVEWIDGLRHSVERVFNKISRFNHSCRPNAVMSWNESQKKGTVYAISSIREGQEVTIAYSSDAKTQFSSLRERCDFLHKTYNFVCTCPACGPEQTLLRKPQDTPQSPVKARLRKARPETDLERDARVRRRLKDIHSRVQFDDVATEIKQSEPGQIEQIETDRQEQLELLYSYIQNLRSLGFQDALLASAYEAKAKNLELGMHTAQHDVPADFPRDPPQSFLRKAQTEWNECFKVHLRASGAEHPLTQAASKEMTRLLTKIAELDVQQV